MIFAAVSISYLNKFLLWVCVCHFDRL